MMRLAHSIPSLQFHLKDIYLSCIYRALLRARVIIREFEAAKRLDNPDEGIFFSSTDLIDNPNRLSREIRDLGQMIPCLVMLETSISKKNISITRN